MSKIKTILSYFPRVYRFKIYKHETRQALIKVEGIEVRPITHENVKDVAWWSKSKVDGYTDLLTKGNVGLYVYCDGKVVAQAWGFIIDLPKYKKISHYLSIRPYSAVIGNGGIHEAYQGRKIYNILMLEMTKYLQDLGFIHIYGDIVVENIAPQRACEKAGFIHIENNLRFQIRTRVLFNIKFNKNSRWFQ